MAERRQTAEAGMWGELVLESLARPRAAARRVLALRVRFEDLLAAAVLLACIGTLISHLALGATGASIDALFAPLVRNPLAAAAAELGWMAVAAVLTAQVGRRFGGSGGLRGALTVVVWLNALTVLIQIVQLVALAVLPPSDLMAGVIVIAPILWLLWAFANFVTELHGFQNPLLVLGGVVLSLLVLFFAVAMLLAILGLTPQETS